MEVGEVMTGTAYPNLIHAEGEVPEEAPEKNFESEETASNMESDFGEEDSSDYDEGEFY